MAIQVYCEACRTINKIDAERSKKRGAVFGRPKTFRVDVTVKGKRVTRMAPNLTLAREIETSTKTDLLRKEYDINVHKVMEIITLEKIWAKYLEWAKVNKKKSWMTDDFFYRKHIEPRFGKKPPASISPFDVEKLKAYMKQAKTPQGKKGYADATIRHVLVLLGHLFKKAREWNLFDGKNPIESVKKPKLDNKVTEFLTDEEMQRLLKDLEDWPCKESADFVKIGLYTGVRKSEIMKLKWRDVDHEMKTLTLRDPKGGVTTSIPLSDEAVSVFSNIPRVSDYVLPGPDGGMKKTFRDPWYKIREAAKLPEGFRYHGLRHNLASHLVSNGMDLFTVSRLLCHKDIRTSERYVHLSDQALRRAADPSGKLLTPKKTEVIKIVE